MHARVGNPIDFASAKRSPSHQHHTHRRGPIHSCIHGKSGRALDDARPKPLTDDPAGQPAGPAGPGQPGWPGNCTKQENNNRGKTPTTRQDLKDLDPNQSTVLSVGLSGAGLAFERVGSTGPRGGSEGGSTGVTKRSIFQTFIIFQIFEFSDFQSLTINDCQ